MLTLRSCFAGERRTHVAFCAGEVLSSRRVNSPIATLLPPLSRFLDYRDSVVTLQNNAKVRMHCQNHWQGPSHKKDLLGAIVVNYGRRLRNAGIHSPVSNLYPPLRAFTIVCQRIELTEYMPVPVPVPVQFTWLRYRVAVALSSRRRHQCNPQTP